MREIEEALKQKRVLLRGARGSGKTDAAIKWARSIGGKVIYAVPNHQSARLVFDSFRARYANEIESINHGTIFLKDGAEIHIVAASNEFRILGMKADAVVLDNVGCMNDAAVYSIMGCASANPSFPFFATYSSVEKNGVKVVKGLERVSEISTYAVDYLDLMEAGRMSANDVRSLLKLIPRKTFQQEMGPYEKEAKPKLRNFLFKHLLDKDK